MQWNGVSHLRWRHKQPDSKLAWAEGSAVKGGLDSQSGCLSGVKPCDCPTSTNHYRALAALAEVAWRALSLVGEAYLACLNAYWRGVGLTN